MNDTRSVTFMVQQDLHRQVKMQAATERKTIKEYVLQLISEDLAAFDDGAGYPDDEQVDTYAEDTDWDIDDLLQDIIEKK